LEWSEDDEGWVGTFNGFRFALSHERMSVPTSRLSDYAKDVLGDALEMEKETRATSQFGVGSLHGRWADPHFMRTIIAFLLICTSAFAGETVVPLKSGETYIVSYGLACVVSDWKHATNDPLGSSLVLTLRNIGAKSIDMDSVTAEDFSLRNARGEEMRIHLWTLRTRSIGYGEDGIIHLSVDHAGVEPQPWTLHFKSKPKAFVPMELTITGIEPRNK
jgi:hypothetical protein